MDQVAAPPDVIMHNGKVITVDGSDSIQQALATQGQTIRAVGSDS